MTGLYEVGYPAAGDPGLAKRVAALLQPTAVELDREWGLDHGTWFVHNLRLYAWGSSESEPFAWALRFDTEVRALLDRGNDAALIDYDALGPDAQLAIPTPDHYLPFLYVLGLRSAGEPLSVPVEGIDGGSISMLTVRVG